MCLLILEEVLKAAERGSYFYQQTLAFAQAPLMPDLHTQPYVSESQDATYWQVRLLTHTLALSLSLSLAAHCR